MSILQYFNRLNGLPDPNGSLSTSLPSRAIAMANSEVQKSDKRSKKRGSYYEYSPEDRAVIGKYAKTNGLTAASRYFSRKLKHPVSISTVTSMKRMYVKEQEIRKRKSADTGDEYQEIVALQKKRGRPLLLGDIDKRVQAYLKKVRDTGGVINSRIIMSAARGLVLYYNPSLLKEKGGHVEFSQNWALSLLERMQYIKRKGSTAKSKQTVSNFMDLKRSFLNEVATTVTMEDIPMELVLNWDQTGIKIVPSSNWTMERQGSKRVELIGTDDKRQITAMFCGSLLGDFLPLQLIYKGKTARCHPRYKFPTGWDITHSPNHWSTEGTMIEYIENIICPYIGGVHHRMNSHDTAALIIMDNFKGQVSQQVTDLLSLYNIHTCLLPPNTTDRLQPLDVSVKQPAKQFLRQKFDEWYSQQVINQLNGKSDEEIEHFELPPIDLSMARM